MGADLLLVYAAIPQGRKPDWKAAEAHIAESGIEVLDPGELADAGDEALAVMREALIEDLRTFRWWIEKSMPRYLLDLNVRGLDLYITGGLSWGDPPTEEFEILDRLVESGTLAAAGFLATFEELENPPEDEIPMSQVIA